MGCVWNRWIHEPRRRVEIVIFKDNDDDILQTDILDDDKGTLISLRLENKMIEVNKGPQKESGRHIWMSFSELKTQKEQSRMTKNLLSNLESQSLHHMMER